MAVSRVDAVLTAKRNQLVDCLAGVRARPLQILHPTLVWLSHYAPVAKRWEAPLLREARESKHGCSASATRTPQVDRVNPMSPPASAGRCFGSFAPEASNAGGSRWESPSSDRSIIPYFTIPQAWFSTGDASQCEPSCTT